MSNPLLEPLGPYIDRKDWALRLAHNPLAGIDVKNLSEEQRELHLNTIRNLVEPTLQMINAARKMQRMLRAGYDRRDPTSCTAQRERSGILGLRGRKSLKDVAFGAAYADALIVKGCTGLGKSTLMQRICSLFPQMYVHDRSEPAGWIRTVQIIYLQVPMPTHRGGLLYAIVSALDQVLGTDFRIQYKNWSVEKLAVEVGILLIQYSVGILIIEELQPINFGDSSHRAQMLNMLLRFLNFGIPIIFIGNPLAFVGISDHSQDMRRLTSEDPIELMPYEARDPDWNQGLVPAIWAHSVMPEPTPLDKEIEMELMLASAGIPDFLWKAVVSAQRLALDSGARRVTADHIRSYRMKSIAFAEFRDLIDGFRNHDPVLLSRYVDVPWEEYALRWGWYPEAILGTETSRGSSGLLPYDAATKRSFYSAHKRLCQDLLSRQTRAATKAESNERARSSAAPNDLRSGTTDTLGKNLGALRADVEASQRSRKVKR